MIYTEVDIAKMYRYALMGQTFEEAKKQIIGEKTDHDQNRIKIILKIVCEYYDITEDKIKSSSRISLCVNARRSFCFLCKKFTLKSLKAIGKAMNRDHASVHHQLKNAQNFLDIGDKQTTEDIETMSEIYYELMLKNNIKNEKIVK